MNIQFLTQSSRGAEEQSGVVLKLGLRPSSPTPTCPTCSTWFKTSPISASLRLCFSALKIYLATALTLILTLSANALPLCWRADWPDCKPVEKLVHRGTDIELQPAWYINGTLATNTSWTLTTYVQTNAVGPWFGPLPGAFFSHTNDVGAAFYSVMVRAEDPSGGVNYTAFARLRMLDSPGFTPGALPLPVPVLDFATVAVLNPPWPAAIASATNALDQSWSSRLSSATNTLDQSWSSQLSQASRDSTNYTASAIAAASTNYATRAEIEAGWLSEWTCVPSKYNVSNIIIMEYPDDYPAGFSFFVPYAGVEQIGTAKRFANSILQISWTLEDAEISFTATRQRIAGPVPQKPSDIGAASTNDLEGIRIQLDAATQTNAMQQAALANCATKADATLTPVYNYSVWLYSGASPGEGYRWNVSYADPGDGETPYFTLARINISTGEYEDRGYDWPGLPQNTPTLRTTISSVDFPGADDGELVISRPILGYQLGSQSNKVLAATNDLVKTQTLANYSTHAETDSATNALDQSWSSRLSQQSQSLSTLGSQVASIGAHLNAEDARFVSTNYNSATHMPEAYVEVKVSNNWITVWREMTRWDWFLGIYTNQYAELSAALANKGEKEYAFYDGVTGKPAPDGFFWISQPRVAIAAGMSYESYADTAGAVWVLESNGMVSDLNGTTNGFFRISDDEGNSQFEIVKGTARTVGATAGAMTRTEVMGVTHWFTTYAVTNAATAPVAMYARDLTSGEWYAETDASCPVNVSWTSPDPGVYVCEWWAKNSEPTMFMKAEYGQGTETRIRQVAPVEMQTIVIGGVKYTLGTAIIDGKTVLTLTP